MMQNVRINKREEERKRGRDGREEERKRGRDGRDESVMKAGEPNRRRH
jgi:hypothetical protein